MRSASEDDMSPHAMKMKLKMSAMPRGPMTRWAMPRGNMTRWARSGRAVIIADRLTPSASAMHPCHYARSIALCTGLHQRSPHSPPIVGQSWDLGVAHFSPFETPKSGPEVQNGPFLMQKIIENGGVLPPVAGLGHLMGMWQGVHKWGFQPPFPRSARGLKVNGHLQK